MIIKVCGTHDANNSYALTELGVDWIGLDFRPDSPNFVRQISSCAGIIPDYGSREAAMGKDTAQKDTTNGEQPLRFGVFADDMPQNIVTRVVNFKLDMVQLEGEESRIMINNLRSTLDPDIRAGIKIMKTLRIQSAEDLTQTKEYEGTVDYFLFKPDATKVDLNIVENYTGNTPFMVGGISAEQLKDAKAIRHAMFIGVDLDDCEDAPAAINALTETE